MFNIELVAPFMRLMSFTLPYPSRCLKMMSILQEPSETKMEPEEKHQTMALENDWLLENRRIASHFLLHKGMGQNLQWHFWGDDYPISLPYPLGPPCVFHRLLWFQLLQDMWSMAFTPIHLHSGVPAFDAPTETWRYVTSVTSVASVAVTKHFKAMDIRKFSTTEWGFLTWCDMMWPVFLVAVIPLESPAISKFQGWSKKCETTGHLNCIHLLDAQAAIDSWKFSNV